MKEIQIISIIASHSILRLLGRSSSENVVLSLWFKKITHDVTFCCKIFIEILCTDYRGVGLSVRIPEEDEKTLKNVSEVVVPLYRGVRVNNKISE